MKVNSKIQSLIHFIVPLILIISHFIGSFVMYGILVVFLNHFQIFSYLCIKVFGILFFIVYFGAGEFYLSYLILKRFWIKNIREIIDPIDPIK